MKPITDVHELFRHQRAIRHFTDEDVPDELVEQVLTAAIIPLGWPDREYGPNRRPPLERFVMRDRWTG